MPAKKIGTMLGVVSGLVAFSVINAHGTLTTFTLTPMSAMFCWKRRAIFSSSGTSATQPNSNSTFFDFAWASAAFAAATSRLGTGSVGSKPGKPSGMGPRAVFPAATRSLIWIRRSTAA